MTGNRIGTIADYRPAPIYVQANFGRNIGIEPMSAERWEEFARRVATAFLVDTETHFGTGTYGGITEDSAHVSGFMPTSGIPFLRVELSDLAAEFGQDSIALVIGSELIKAAR